MHHLRVTKTWMERKALPQLCSARERLFQIHITNSHAVTQRQSLFVTSVSKPFRINSKSFDFFLNVSFTPVAGLIFETKNRAIFLERFFRRGIPAREQVSRAIILARF